MKKKFLLLPLFTLLSLTLSNCGFADFFTTRVTSVTISDANDSYAIGDVYKDESIITVVANYNNGRSKNLSLSEVSSCNLYTLVNGVTTEYDYTKPFSISSPDFKFSVTLDGITSNVLSINVLQEHVYVTSIKIEGPTELDSKSTGNYTLTVTPENYTTKLSFHCDYENAFSFTPTQTGFDAYAIKAGEHTITVSSKSGKTTTISASIEVNVTAQAEIVQMAQTYNDYTKYNRFNLSACPLEGNPKLLVIPVWLTDSNRFIRNKEQVRNDIASAYFGTTSETGWHSVSSYYYAESLGKLNLTGTVSEWYPCSYSSSQVGLESFDTSDLVNKAISWYFNSNPSDSRDNYDLDGDKYLDGVMLIYGAPDNSHSAFSNYENLWAYCFWIQKSAGSTIIPNVYFWASYDFMYNSASALSRAGSNYGSGDTSHCTIDAHTYIHEMGHVFGLQDYYDYPQKYNPAGGFSMQDCNVGGHDPYSLLAFGWADAYVPSDSVTITIGEFTKTHDLILLSNNFNEYNSPFDEYLLLELYSPNDLNAFDTTYTYCNRYPTGPKKAGIRLWHIDSRLATTTNGISYKLANANVKQGDITLGMSNTYDSGNPEYKQYLSVLGSDYYDYNLLQLIRNNITTTYKPERNDRSYLKTEDLFRTGDSFSISSYNKQFKNGTRFNNGATIDWSFSVDSIDLVGGVAEATITITRG